MKLVDQKYIRMSRTCGSTMWMLDEGCGTSYLASQCKGSSGLEKDLEDGWIVKHCWEDRYQIVFLLERDR